LTESEHYLAEYLQWLTIEKGRSRATIEAYRRDLLRLIAWMQKHQLDVVSVRERDLEQYANTLRRQKRAESSISRGVASIRGWFGYLLVEGYVELDPSARLKGGRRGRTLPKPLGEEEIESLINSIERSTPSDLRDRALLELLYGTGARVSEVVGIGLEDLDFDEELILLTGKGNKQRLVPMGRSLKTALEDYLGPGGRSSFPDARRTLASFSTPAGECSRAKASTSSSTNAHSTWASSAHVSAPTSFATAARRTCWPTERTSAWCRSYSDTCPSQRRRSTPRSR
jgi:site-specific recombinase XerD